MKAFPVSPFHRYNLFRNPFGELSRSERGELAVFDIAPWAQILSDARHVVQFIGECGRGKTSHLLAIQHAMPEFEYIYLPEDGARPKVPKYRPIIVDEAQRLSLRQLRRVLAESGPLVFGTHVDLSLQIQEAKLQACTLHVGDALQASRLMAILNSRMAASRLTDGPVPQISNAAAVRLIDNYGTDIRSIEKHLYDEFQKSAWEQQSWPPPE